jgi:hypothetical protein
LILNFLRRRPAATIYESINEERPGKMRYAISAL